MNIANFSHISYNTSEKAIIAMKGLWAVDGVHPDLINFLSDCWYEVHYFDRGWDTIVWIEEWSLEIYQNSILDYVNFLLDSWKEVHLLGISFWGYLSLKFAQEYSKKVKSVTAIAPLITCYKTISSLSIGELNNEKKYTVWLLNGLKLDILRVNVDILKNEQEIQIDIPWLVTLGTEDEFTSIADLSMIQWDRLKKIPLEWIWHLEITANIRNKCEIENFLKTI